MRARRAANRMQILSLGMLSILSAFFLGIQTAGEVDTVASTSAVNVLSTGDVNGDGKVDVRDAIDILELIRSDDHPTVEQLLADPDQDGLLTIDDALQILRSVDSRR